MNPIPEEEDQNIERVRTGQRIVLYSVLMNLVAMVLYFGAIIVARFLGDRTLVATAEILRLVVWLGALIVGLIGVIRLTKGLGYSIVGRILFPISMFIPCINLIVLLILSSKATMVLTKAGYKVGLMGATERNG
jgi:hypothetical protein